MYLKNVTIVGRNPKKNFCSLRSQHYFVPNSQNCGTADIYILSPTSNSHSSRPFLVPPLFEPNLRHCRKGRVFIWKLKVQTVLIFTYFYFFYINCIHCIQYNYNDATVSDVTCAAVYDLVKCKSFRSFQHSVFLYAHFMSLLCVSLLVLLYQVACDNFSLNEYDAIQCKKLIRRWDSQTWLFVCLTTPFLFNPLGGGDPLGRPSWFLMDELPDGQATIWCKNIPEKLNPLSRVHARHTSHLAKNRLKCPK